MFVIPPASSDRAFPAAETTTRHMHSGPGVIALLCMRSPSVLADGGSSQSPVRLPPPRHVWTGRFLPSAPPRRMGEGRENSVRSSARCRVDSCQLLERFQVRLSSAGGSRSLCFPSGGIIDYHKHGKLI